MAQVEEQILAEGAQIVWVLEQTTRFQPGTAEECRRFMAGRGSDQGLCVGDGQTMPVPGVWDDAPFAVGRGFDLIVRRSEMRVLWISTHGTPSGNENLSGAEVLDAVRRFKP